MNRGAWRDFFITVFFLGIAFVIALLSSVAAEQNASMQAAIAAAISLVLALVGALYIIPRLARNVRMEILRFAVRTTVTVEGLLFIVFLMVIAFAAWNTGNNLLYLVLSAMLAFLVAANLIARLSLGDVAVQLRFPDHIFAGEPASLNVTLLNHKRVMPSYSLMVEALSDESNADEDAGTQKKGDSEGEKQRENSSNKLARSASPRPRVAVSDPPALAIGKLAYYVLIPARASVRQRVLYTFERRGRYPITGFRISTKFPAGFFKKWRRIDASGEIVVYPKPQPLDDFYHALPMLAGQIQSQVRGWGDELYGIRRYHPSDHMRHIDWKATAKSSQMMVREHVREEEWRLTIVFDTARPQTPEPISQKQEAQTARKPDKQQDDSAEPTAAPRSFEERFERAVVMAASLANHFILERADVELITADERHYVASGNGYEHLYKILRSLATLQPTLSSESKPATGAKGKLRSLFKRTRNPHDEKRAGATEPGRNADGGIAWRLLDEVPVLADERRFKILITSAAKRTIPANIWRSAHVVFMEDV